MDPGDEVATDLLLGSDGEAYSAAGGGELCMTWRAGPWQKRGRSVASPYEVSWLQNRKRITESLSAGLETMPLSYSHLLVLDGPPALHGRSKGKAAPPRQPGSLCAIEDRLSRGPGGGSL